MGVSRGAPWWLGWLLVGGLLALFVGERIVGEGALRLAFSGVGVLLVLGSVVWRARSWWSLEGEARQAEGWLTLAYAGCAVALLGYLLGSADGVRWLGIEFADAEAEARYRVVMQVLWPTVLAVSLLPVLGAQLALGAHRHARGEATRVEAFRVVETATSGLVVALAGAFLFVLGYIVSERDRSLDLSYFRTASPGAATEAMVAGLEEPLRVLLFFPEVNPVKDEAMRYFRRLAEGSPSGGIRIEEHDRLVSPRLAEEHRVTEDGTVLLLHGERSERLTLGTTMAGARTTLRALDRHVQSALMPLLRERRTVYLTAGHGELNDPSSAGPLAATPLGGVETLRELLRVLNYDVQDLGLAGGLGNEVPSDAAIVMVLGPRRPFLEEELATLQRYVAGGGALLLALDPDSEFELGPLEESLGVRYAAVPLADDRQHLRQRGDASDRRLIITDRFSSHETVTTLARAGMGAGVLFVGPGHLEALEGSGASPLFVVRSLPTAFADESRDYRFDEETETRRSYNLVAAVEVEASGAGAAPEAASSGVEAASAAAEAPAGPDGEAEVDDGEAGGAESEDRQTPGSGGGGLDGASPGPARGLVYASSSVFADAVLGGIGLNAALAADGILWLGGEEEFAGETESEEDVPIVHTRAEDVLWFYGIIFGAPALLLGAGLFGVYRARRPRERGS